MNKILVCTDGSNYAREACRYAAWLAQRTGARVEALYVSSLWEFELPFLFDLGGSIGATPYTAVTGQLEEIENKKAGMIREAVHNMLESHGVPIDDSTFQHSTGLLVDCLDDYESGDNAANLIILGKRGENAESAKDHLGGNMERVVRASRQPCLVTNREFREIKKVCLAYDGSKSAEKALDWLMSENVLRDLELHVICVDEGRGETDHARDLNIAETRLNEAGIAAHCQLLTGDVEDEVESFTEKNQIDLLVMGAYGHGRIRELLIGSTTSDLIRRCKIPVMLFR
ncbi:MAG: universal stress protein [Puniceicoccales bacterium]